MANIATPRSQGQGRPQLPAMPASRPVRYASCDPCRLSKLACDHTQPVCARCTRRGIADECSYRKNPFKKRKRLDPASAGPLPENAR